MCRLQQGVHKNSYTHSTIEKQLHAQHSWRLRGETSPAHDFVSSAFTHCQYSPICTDSTAHLSMKMVMLAFCTCLSAIYVIGQSMITAFIVTSFIHDFYCTVYLFFSLPLHIHTLNGYLRSSMSRALLSPEISFCSSGAQNMQSQSGCTTALKPRMKASAWSLICRNMRKWAIRCT